MDSMTKIFPVTVTKLRDPVTKAIKNISRALDGLAAPSPSSAGEQKVESLEEMLQEVLENRSVDWMTDDPEERGRERDKKMGKEKHGVCIIVDYLHFIPDPRKEHFL